MLASSTLTRLTGNRVGGCPVTVRPVLDTGLCWMPAGPDYWPRGLDPLNYGGKWFNTPPCAVGSYEVELPAPVGEVIEVRVSGAVIDPANYAVIGNSIVWQGAGLPPWPRSQMLTKPDNADGSFTVTYLNSYPVDGQGACAAGILALEYAKAAAGSNKCRLPSTVTSIVRQGVTMDIASGAFPNGMTGIREVDAYIAVWNPDGLRQQSTVWSPDTRRARTVR